MKTLPRLQGWAAWLRGPTGCLATMRLPASPLKLSAKADEGGLLGPLCTPNPDTCTTRVCSVRQLWLVIHVLCRPVTVTVLSLLHPCCVTPATVTHPTWMSQPCVVRLPCGLAFPISLPWSAMSQTLQLLVATHLPLPGRVHCTLCCVLLCIGGDGAQGLMRVGMLYTTAYGPRESVISFPPSVHLFITCPQPLLCIYLYFKTGSP